MVTTVGVLMAGIDSRIVIVGLPQVAQALHSDAEQDIWITQSYVLGSTVALLLIGRISDVVGRVRLYTSGFGVFTVGSLLTGLALDPNQVIVFRFIQGLGSAILFTNSAAMIVDATPQGELGYFLGINQVAFRMGAMAGLTISGVVLTFFYDWRILFFINVPIGIFGTVWAHAKLREIARLEKGAPIDWLGFLAFAIFISSFLLALTLASYGIGERTAAIVLGIMGGAALGLFVFLELRTKHPLLDLRLLRIREFSSGVAAQLLNAIAFGALLLLLSLYFQLILGMTPLVAGLTILPLDISTALLGPISGKLSDRYGYVPFTTGGLGLMSVALYLFSTTDASTPTPHIILYLVLCGAGLATFASPNMSSIMGSVPAERRGIASGFRATFFNLGFVVSLNLAILVLTFTVPYSVVSQIIATGNPLVISGVDRASFVRGLQNTYLWLAVINTLAILPSALRGRRARVEGPFQAPPQPAAEN